MGPALRMAGQVRAKSHLPDAAAGFRSTDLTAWTDVSRIEFAVDGRIETRPLQGVSAVRFDEGLMETPR